MYKWITNYANSTTTAFLPSINFDKFENYYDFWFAYFLERCANIFRYKGLPFKQKELELRLLLNGYCGLCKLNSSSHAFDAISVAMSGITNYSDEWTTAVGVTPQTQVMFQIYGNPKSIEGIEATGIIADNNDLRLSATPLISYYATILAHIDLSIKKVAVKMRNMALIRGSDSKAVDTINDWLKAVENGASKAVLDEESYLELNTGIKVDPIGSDKGELDSLLMARDKYILSYFSDIGINSAIEKKERLISSEVDVGFNRVFFNISNMYESRQKMCEDIKGLYGLDVEVEFNPYLPNEYSSIVSTQTKKEGEINEET